MVLYERDFAEDIRTAMMAQGWLYDSGVRLAAKQGLVIEDIVSWVEVSQPNVWAELIRQYGTSAGDVLASAVRAEMRRSGTLGVLRRGVLIRGVSMRVQMLQPCPHGVGGEVLLRKYNANRLRVLTEVSFSDSQRGRLDLVLTLNGIPTATAELKFGQNQAVEAAITQYKEDRNIGRLSNGMILSPIEGACVHFAVSESEVFSCGWLCGAESKFLPFNLGNNFGAGNPEKSDGYQTDYLWNRVWSPDSWIELCMYTIKVNGERPTDGQGWIFPRFHQWDVVQKSMDSVRGDGLGRPHLVQHSAGSGKTKTIAWMADALARVKDNAGRSLYEGVIVLSDRDVIDRQLQREVELFASTNGMVACINAQTQSKSTALSTALSLGKRIIVCTIQTFPHIREEINRLGGEHHRYAVLADEAHSSQSGKNAAAMRGTFYAVDASARQAESNPESVTEYQDEWQRIVANDMASRVSGGGRITFFAFTATPKAKTTEMFGTLPNPNAPRSEQNKPGPFHLYSMRQAIAEGFILDVLKNYTTFDMFAEVSLRNHADSTQVIDSGRGRRDIVRWVRQHPESVEARASQILDHFESIVHPLLGGRAKAMVVSEGRMEAVVMARTLHARARTLGLNVRVMVAFSGALVFGDEALSESAINAQLGGSSGDLAENFAANGDILVVANKFQTGFDQPLLCGMYVDRRLGGIQAVQTLSRLNRTYPGKDRVYILDFVNRLEAILDGFAPYYTAADLMAQGDPDTVVELRSRLEQGAFCRPDEAEAVAHAVTRYRRNKTTVNRMAIVSAVHAIWGPIVERWNNAHRELSGMDEHDGRRERYELQVKDLLNLRNDVQLYVRAYQFFSQMENYAETGFEYLYIAASYVLAHLRFHDREASADIAELVLDEYRIVSLETPLESDTLEERVAQLMPSFTSVLSGGARIADADEVTMRQLVDDFNQVFNEGGRQLNVGEDELRLLIGVVINSLNSDEGRRLREEKGLSVDDMEEVVSYTLSSSMDRFSKLSMDLLNYDDTRRGISSLLLRYAMNHVSKD